MSLKDWSRNGWLVEHKTSPAEIAELLEIAKRDLADCNVEGLSADVRSGSNGDDQFGRTD